LICIVAPVDLHRAGLMRPRHIAVGAIGVVLMAFVAFGSVYPVPDYPYNLLPYLFAAYLLLGAMWYGVLSSRAPNFLSSLQNDLEI